MCVESPHKWVKWLTIAEWWYNTTYHTTIKATPYEIMGKLLLFIFHIYRENPTLIWWIGALVKEKKC